MLSWEDPQPGDRDVRSAYLIWQVNNIGEARLPPAVYSRPNLAPLKSYPAPRCFLKGKDVVETLLPKQCASLGRP